MNNIVVHMVYIYTNSRELRISSLTVDENGAPIAAGVKEQRKADAIRQFCETYNAGDLRSMQEKILQFDKKSSDSLWFENRQVSRHF